MNHVLRNLTLASFAGVLISLLSMEYVSHSFNPRIIAGGWTYYGFPFPLFGNNVEDLIGTRHYFFIFNTLADFLIWFAISFVLITTFSAILTRTRTTG